MVRDDVGKEQRVDTGARTLERPGAARRQLPPVPPSVSEARRLVRGLLEEHGREDLEDTAALLVSELVTNALLHAGTTIEVEARVEGNVLRVLVGDGSHHLPVTRRYGTTAGTGRGLRMVAQLVDDWGVTTHETGKTVWFTLSDGDRIADVPGAFTGVEADGVAPDLPAADVVEVELREMPLLLHAAWQEHIGALLREFMLVSLDEDGSGDELEAITVHAEATDALALLAEHVPEVEVGIEPDELMANATEPFVSAEKIVVPVPRSSLGSFETLEQAVLKALSLSFQDRTLTPPTQPEVQALRQWICEQVRTQAAGGGPAPWVVNSPTFGPPVPATAWDPTAVAEADTGQIAADDANRLLAVSRSAATLLGYDDPAELVGRRLVSIIPDRFRQAHLAGFTLMQITGRKPLLNREVEVPALRRDGGEVLVRLLVRSERDDHGRLVFVAEIEPADV